MIKVEVSKNQIKISGHSDYEEFGKDIVCSAASSIFITTVNAIMKINNDSIQYEHKEDINNDNNDYSLINILKHNQVTDKLILNMIDLLKELSMKYPKDIIVKER